MNRTKLSQEEFLKRAKSWHKEKYDYSKAIYTGKYGILTIGCPIHGEFKQTAQLHLRGCGCSKCRYETIKIKVTKTTEYFIEKAKLIHGNLYDYSLVNYTKTIEPVNIICKYHGIFSQQPNGHLRGGGCQICAKYQNYLSKYYKHIDDTYISNLKGFLYIVNLIGNNENFYKIGISKNIKKRFKEFERKYKVTPILIEENILLYNVEIEYKLLKELKEYKYIPKLYMPGRQECLNINPLNYYNSIKDDFTKKR